MVRLHSSQPFRRVMRSGQIVASNDSFIEELINDEDYMFTDDFRLLTKIAPNGKLQESFREKCVYSGKEGYKILTYKRRKLSYHRVIYRKFVGPLEADLVINHIDGNPSNNSPDNLELVTQSNNVLHKFSMR